VSILADKILYLSSTDSELHDYLIGCGALVDATETEPAVVDPSLIEESLLAMFKAMVIVDSGIPSPITYEGMTITVTLAEYIDGMLHYTAESNADIDGDYRVVNPPIGVVVTEAIGDPWDEGYVPAVAVEDPEGAFVGIVIRQVVPDAISRGWVPA